VIADDVLELVPPSLLYSEDIADFQRLFGNELTAAGCSLRELAPASREITYTEQRKQREHFDRYAKDDHPGFADYTKSVFIRTACARFIDLWKAQLGNSRGWILDIGCGTGNSSFPFADRHTVAAFDISKKVIRRDTEEARARGAMANTTFFVADGGFLSFKDQSFEFVQTFGSLHHLPNPAQAVQDILRILTPAGIYFGVENNKTSLRWIFDLLMKVMPLWVEEAGAEPLISEDMLKAWVAQASVELYFQTSVFLPPHLFNLLGMTAARPLLKWSDEACMHVPWLKANGGQLVYHMRKMNR
jgi:SAM-dependent methyltransferase